MSAVYIIHFSEPYEHARHYTGFAENVDERFEQHKRGRGARLTQVVVDSGRRLILARIFPGRDRKYERKLKDGGNIKAYCPICKEQKEKEA
jgi:predicted GIY-YIG superfamily endonuclease